MRYITPENVLLIGSILLFFCIVASQSSYRFGIPTLIFFLGVGMLAGSEGIGKISFNNPSTAQFIGIVALNFILFSGGMGTRWRHVKPIIRPGISLASLGVLLTAILVGLFVWLIMDVTMVEAFLLGSIISSTDAAAVFSILQNNNMELKHNLRPLLELESGSNDPMAFLLTILFLNIIKNPDTSLWMAVPSFLGEVLIGGAMGFFMGWLITMAVNKVKIQYAGLYPVLVVAMMFFTYTFTDLIYGNGFLAIYIASVYFGNQKVVHKEVIQNTFDGFAWLMQIILFLSLGLLVYPSMLWTVAGTGVLIALFLIFVARPAAVFVSLARSRKFGFGSKLFISWVGLRGAAPIVFATFPMIAKLDQASTIFHIVFFISLLSMLLQGTSIPWVARKLHLSVPIPKHLISRKELDQKTELVELVVRPGSAVIDRKLVEIEFPENTRVSMIRRKGEYLIPEGSTVIHVSDHLFILCKDPKEVQMIV